MQKLLGHYRIMPHQAVAKGFFLRQRLNSPACAAFRAGPVE